MFTQLPKILLFKISNEFNVLLYLLNCHLHYLLLKVRDNQADIETTMKLRLQKHICNGYYNLPIPKVNMYKSLS